MKFRYLLALAAAISLPALAQLGPAGVPGAPGLVPEPAAPVKPAAPQPGDSSKPATPAKVPPACAKAKNVEQCVTRLERRRKARAACKGKADADYRRCVSDYLSRRKK